MTTTLLWDIDGVFVDTERLHYLAWRWLARHYGTDLTAAEYAPMIGRGGEENMHTFCDLKHITEDHAVLRALRREKYDELRRVGVPVLKENVELARRFKAEYPLLVHTAVSSARRSDIESNLSVAGLQKFFIRTISFEDRPGLRRKPAPDLYRYALEVLGVSSGECLAFEDSANGAAAAHAAGIAVVTVPTTLTPREILSVYK